MKKLKPMKQLLDTLREGCSKEKLFLIDAAEDLIKTRERIKNSMDEKQYEELRRSLDDSIFYLLFSTDEESDIPSMVTLMHD